MLMERQASVWLLKVIAVFWRASSSPQLLFLGDKGKGNPRVVGKEIAKNTTSLQQTPLFMSLLINFVLFLIAHITAER